MYDIPDVEQKIWGQRTQIYSDGKVEVYLLDVKPVDGKPVVCSLHHHTMKYNQFNVVSGRLGVEHGGKADKEDPMHVIGGNWQLNPGDQYIVPPNEVHRFVVIEPDLVIETTWADEITEDIHRRDVGHVIDTWPEDADESGDTEEHGDGAYDGGGEFI